MKRGRSKLQDDPSHRGEAQRRSRAMVTHVWLWLIASGCASLGKEPPDSQRQLWVSCATPPTLNWVGDSPSAPEDLRSAVESSALEDARLQCESTHQRTFRLQLVASPIGSSWHVRETRFNYPVSPRAPLPDTPLTETLTCQHTWHVAPWGAGHLTSKCGLPSAEAAPVQTLNPASDSAPRSSAQRASLPFTMRGFNYYPAYASWEQFWGRYPRDSVKVDFAAMTAAGANTIRVFVSYAATGGPRPDALHLENMRHLLDTAADNRLEVIVTLFDLHLPYAPENWPDADAHLEAWLSRFATHDALLAWDIKNEPDLDFPSFGEAHVRHFLRFAAERARVYDPNHMLTVGFASAKQTCNEPLSRWDFETFHHYGTPEDLERAGDDLRIRCEGRPYVLGEFGHPSHPTGAAEQDAYFGLVRAVLGRTGVSGYLIWSWTDFIHAPHEATSGDPLRFMRETSFGMVTADGLPKPALGTVGTWFRSEGASP